MREKLQAKLADTTTNLQHSEQQLVEFKAEKEAINAQMMQHQQQLLSQQAQSQEKLEQRLTSEVKKLRSQIEELECTNATLQNKLSKANTDVS